MNSEILWYTSRASGVVSSVLFSTVFVLGVMLSGQFSRRADGVTVVAALHRWLSPVSVVFLLVHIVTAVVDSYVSVHVWDILVPFVSDYEPLWMGLGTVSIDILISVLVTSVLRQRMPERIWRAVHQTAYLCWPVAMIHAIGLATSDNLGLMAVSLGCLAAGGLVVAWRLVHESPDRERRLAVAGQEWS